MTNSSRSSSGVGTLAIEKDRLSSVPGTAMSTYWPGKKASGVSPSVRSTRCRMSPVTGSMLSTSASTSRIGKPERIMSSS